MANPNPAEIIKTIANALSNLRNATTNDALLEQYMGDFSLAGSFFRHDAAQITDEGVALRRRITRTADRTSFVAMMDDVHRLFRTELPKRLDITVDKTALDAPTCNLMEAVAANTLKYQAAVDAEYARQTAGKPEGTYVSFVRLMEDKDVKTETTLSYVLNYELKTSTLTQANAAMPMMIAGKKASLPNKENIGAVIFALSLAKNNVTDLNRTPVGTRDFIIDTLGQITAIPKTIRSACSHHPETQAEFERTYASLLPDMQAAIGRSQHSLQVLNLAGERTGLAKSANASRDLLDAAGLPHYPQELKSRLECALIMDCVTDQAPAEFRARLGHVRDAALSGKPLSAQAATVISELRALGKGDNALYSKQLELCDGFMRSPGRSSAASSPPPL